MAGRTAFDLKRIALSACLSLTLAWPVAAATCTADDFAQAVDAAGAGLRAINQKNAPELQSRLKKLKAEKGWADDDYEEKAYDLLQDSRIAELDGQANELLVNIDGLSRAPEGSAPDCSRLDELKAASVELQAVMKAKSAYTLAKLDKLLVGGAVAAAPQAPATAAKPPVAAAPSPTPPKPVERPADSEKPAAGGWTTTTEVASQQPPAAGVPQAGVFMTPEDDGYSIEEIRDATRGFFGTVSTNLAAVIEHAFRNSGRPSAYVLGTEGGGAFLAGLRYGEGTLYLRQGGTQKVYWHGPSLGYDFGAAGSRTLFLIYRLRETEGLFRRFTGIDGSAYLVGGVGITYLKGGDVVMAPIRSGLGLRLGASVGYVRFTPRPTWNPF